MMSLRDWDRLLSEHALMDTKIFSRIKKAVKRFVALFLLITFYCHSIFLIHHFGPTHEILALITHAQTYSLNTHGQLTTRARGLC